MVLGLGTEIAEIAEVAPERRQFEWFWGLVQRSPKSPRLGPNIDTLSGLGVWVRYRRNRRGWANVGSLHSFGVWELDRQNRRG